LYTTIDDAFNNGSELHLRGEFIFNDTYILTSGRKLVAQDGALLKYPSGKTLEIAGGATLEADNATFTSISGIWTGIVYRTSGNGYINECNISNATREILDNSGTSDLVFTGNTITNSTNGIYCGYSGNPEIRNNTLSNISNYAIYCSGSDTSMVIADNTISNSTYGLYCYNANPQISSNKLTNSKVYFNNSNSELTNNLITVSGG
jgi:parallel beta-helix repeat protein